MSRARRSADMDALALGMLLFAGGTLVLSSSTLLSTSLLLIAGAISAWRPVGAAWAVCAALPTVSHPVAVDGREFMLLELAVLVAFAGLLVATLREVLQTRRISWLISDRELAVVVLGALALLSAGVLALYFQLDPAHRTEALRLFRWTIVEPLMVYGVMRYAIQKRGARWLLWVTTATGVVVALAGIGLLIVDPGRFEGDGVRRAVGPYLHPNNLALYLERVFVFLAAAVIVGGIRLNRPVLVAGSVIGIAMLATLSRGMPPAVVAGIVLAAWMARNRRVLLASGVVIVVGAGAFALAVTQRSRGDSVDAFLGERRAVWTAAWKMVQDYPISGIGMDQFLYQHAPRYIAPEAWSERYLSHPHNILLDSWLSLGVTGLVVLLMAVALLAVSAVRMREQGRARPLAAAATATLTTGLVHGLVDNGYFLPDLAAMTWMLVAIITTADPPGLDLT